MDNELRNVLAFLLVVAAIVSAPILAGVWLAKTGPCVEVISADGSCSNRSHRMVREPGVTLCLCHDAPAVGSARP